MTAASFPSRKNKKQKSAVALWQGWKILKISRMLVFLAVAAVCVAVLGGGYYGNIAKDAVPVNAGLVSHAAPWVKWRDILFAGVPGLSRFTEKPTPVKTTPPISADRLVNRFVFFLTNINIDDKPSFLSQEIPFFITTKNANAKNAAVSLPAGGAQKPMAFYPDKPGLPPVKLSDKPLVGIYHTHTAESFIPSSGVSHKPGGQLGDIINVGAALVSELEKRGVKAVHSKAVHDYPSFMKAYGESEVSIRKMLAENPSLKVLLDIHRDAAKRENSIININGREAAKLSIVLAKGQEDLPQPLWQQNHAFAKLIDTQLNIYYPGLCKGIQFSEWRYNQHLHPGALLIEVGCQENSVEEGCYSMELLANILTEVLKEAKI